MAKVIEGKDIIKPGSLNEHIKQLQDAKKAYDALDKSVLKFSKDLKSAMTGNKGQSAADMEKMNAALQQSTNLRKASVESQKQQLAIEKQLKAATDEEVKGKLRYTEATKKQKAELQDLLVIENKEAGTLQKIAAENRKLRRERESLNLETKKGQQRLQEINRALDANNAKIKASSDAMKKQRLNVGAYGAAVSKVTTLLKGFGATMLAAFSIQAIKGFVKGSIDAFRIQEKAVAKVTQAVKSTGGAAGKTTEELQKMASALQKNTLFGDEQILNDVSAQLLTFTNISGAAFDRAQKAALDVATVLDADLKGTAIQLGKALNDPVKGIAALSRSGIQFSEDQKAMIKGLVETNRLADAQNVILTELEKQYGGQAAAAAEVDGGITQLSNAFGDFKEMVGKELMEALKPTIKTLKEFFEGLDQDDVRKFVLLIFDFIKVLKMVGLGLGAYKVAAGAAAKANQLLGKSLPVKSFGALGIAIYGAYEIFKGFNDLYEEANQNARYFEELQGRIAKEVDQEAVSLQLLGEQLLKTNAGSKEREEIMKKINDEYGITLENLDDENAMINQLVSAYDGYVKQLEKKVMARVLEEELVQFTAEMREINRAYEDGKLNQYLYNQLVEKGAERINGLKKELALLQKDGLGPVKETAKETADVLGDRFVKAVDKASDKVKKLKKLTKDEFAPPEDTAQEFDPDADFQNTLKQLDFNQKELERTLIINGASTEEIQKKLDLQELDNLKKKRDRALELYGENSQEFLDADLEYRKEIRKRNDEQELAEKEAEEKAKQDRLDALNKMRDETLDILKQITDGLAAEIDRRIDLRKSEIDASQSEIQRLQQLAAGGDENAAKAIKAEQVRIAKEKIEIEALQKKKRNLLITVAALERVSQNIGSGDPNPFKSASKSMQDFLSNLPTFFKGTDMTVADALGKTGTRDGHTVRVHDNEHIISSNDSDKLHRAGFKRTKDIVNAAMVAQNLGLAGRVIKKNVSGNSDALLVSRLESLENTFKDSISQIETTVIDPVKLFATISKGNNVKNITHSKGFRVE